MTNIDKIKQIREETSISMAECKKALEESDWDIEKSKEILRKRGKDLAGKKVDREAKEGIIEAYIHSNGNVGVMIKLCCESDFVSKSSDFKNLAHEICLQIAAMKPLFLKEDDIPKEFLDKENEIFEEQLKDLDKPKEIMEGIIKGKIEKRKKEICLLNQPWVKDQTKNIKDLINDYVSKIGENVYIKKFIYYQF